MRKILHNYDKKPDPDTNADGLILKRYLQEPT